MALKFRRKDGSDTEQAPAEPVKPGGKGRPTPKRKEAEALARAKARPPRTKAELAKRQRELRTEESRKIREGMKAGDERYFLPRDQGPMRRFLRDFVDSRFAVVELMIPLLIISMILPFFGPTMAAASSMVMMATVLFVVMDLVILRFRVRRQLVRRFPGESYKGTTFYALTRAMQMRFMRMPKARVKIGQELPTTYR